MGLGAGGSRRYRSIPRAAWGAARRAFRVSPEEGREAPADVQLPRGWCVGFTPVNKINTWMPLAPSRARVPRAGVCAVPVGFGAGCRCDTANSPLLAPVPSRCACSFHVPRCGLRGGVEGSKGRKRAQPRGGSRLVSLLRLRARAGSRGSRAQPDQTADRAGRQQPSFLPHVPTGSLPVCVSLQDAQGRVLPRGRAVRDGSRAGELPPCRTGPQQGQGSSSQLFLAAGVISGSDCHPVAARFPCAHPMIPLMLSMTHLWAILWGCDAHRAAMPISWGYNPMDPIEHRAEMCRLPPRLCPSSF